MHVVDAVWQNLHAHQSGAGSACIPQKPKPHHLNCFRATLLGAPEAQMGNQPPPCIRFGLFGRIRALTEVVDPHLKT
jgi:hypothetical protein